MFLSLSLTLVLFGSPPDFDQVARTFVDALTRNDPGALTTGTILGRAGTAPEILEIHTDISIPSYRIVSIEPGPESTELLMELEGTAVSVGMRRRVPWPRWWVVEVKPDGDGWRIAQAVLLERKLAIATVLSSDEERDRLLRERPEIDVDRYFMQLANEAGTRGDSACDTMLWLLRESHARGIVSEEITTLLQMSGIAVDRWDALGALPPAEEALALSEKAQLPAALSDSYFSLGIAYWVANRLPEAVRALRRSAEYIGRFDDPRMPLRALYMAAQLEIRQNNLRGALALADQLEELVARYPSPRASMDVAFQLAAIHERIGNTEIARRNYEVARMAARGLRDRTAEAFAVYDLSSIDPISNEPWEVIRRVEEALEIGKGTLGSDWVAAMRLSLAELQRDEGDLERADRTFAEVLEAAHTSDERNVLAAAYTGRSGLRLSQGRTADALVDAREGRRFAQSEGATGRSRMEPSLLQALTAEGRALRALGQRDAAAATWRVAVDVMELELVDQAVDETGSTAILKKKLEPYRELLDLFVEEGCAREALVVAERMRARSLRDSLRLGRIDLSVGLDDAKRKRERELESAMAEVNRALFAATDPDEIARLQRDRDDARLALRKFRTELYVKHPEIGRRRAETIEEYDAWSPVVSPGELVLELAVSSDSVVLFAMEGTKISVRRIDLSKEELERLVDAFVAALENRDFRYRKAGRSLYDLLLGPVTEQLSRVDRIRIVPDGPLWRLPFHALIDADGKHLAERVAVSYSPSLSLAQRPAGGRAPRRTLFALADPAVGANTAHAARSVYRDATLGRLPEAATEARAIARLYANPQVGVGAEARESVFKRDALEFRVLHLAAHSIIDDGAPMFSSIVLASSDANSLEDGLLEAREIADLKLQADVAVLSACETARGRITPGEGMVGLSWAFLAAGVPTTVVSQWKVGSASTAELMILFHRRLRNGAPAGQALRRAMLELRKNPRWRHPFYWAPFVVIENVGRG